MNYGYTRVVLSKDSIYFVGGGMSVWEKGTNTALILMCLVTIGVAGDHFLVHRLAKEPAIESRLSGDLTSLIATGATATAIVVVSSNCKFCLSSTDFYRRLAAFQSEQQGAFQVSFVSLLDDDDGRHFVKVAGLPPDSFRPTPNSLRERVKGTPMLIVVNGQGQVAATWSGQLTQGKEDGVFETIRTVLKNNSAPSQ